MSKLSENVTNVLFQLMVISSKQWIVLCSKMKRSGVSEWVSEWQVHLLSCSGQLKTQNSAQLDTDQYRATGVAKNQTFQHSGAH